MATPQPPKEKPASNALPIDINTPGLLKALGSIANLHVWELLRRQRAPCTARAIATLAGLPVTLVLDALNHFAVAGLVRWHRVTSRQKSVRWSTTQDAIFVQYRVGDGADQALLAKLGTLFGETRERELRAKFKPLGGTAPSDFRWEGLHAGRFTSDELKELWRMLLEFERFFARVSNRAQPGLVVGSHDCTHHIKMEVTPLLHGVLPTPVLQIFGVAGAHDVTRVHTSDANRSLTLRERQIAHQLAEGMTTQSLAKHLRLSPHTVVEYTRRIYKKLGVSNRAQLGARLPKHK